MKKKLIGVLAVFFFSTAYAVDWKIFADGEPSKLYLDMDSLRTINGNRRGWFMISYSKKEDMNGVDIKSYLHLVEMDCNQGRVRTLSAIFKSDEMGKGETMGHFDKMESAKWVFIVPGTVGEYQMNLLCKRTLGK